MKTAIAATRLSVALLFAAGLNAPAQAALIDRGGGLIYDTDLNVTWLQDANYAKTSGYDADGLMTWAQATTWAANLSYYDSIRNVTYTDWRLPTWTDTGAAGAQCTYGGTDCGYNVNPASSEMAHLYFVELGNQSYYTTTGAVSGAYAGGANPNSTLDSTGPFINFKDAYWYGVDYSPLDTFVLDTGFGRQVPYNKGNLFYALAVRPGDVATIPEPETYGLMLAGLGLVGSAARRRRGQTPA